MLKNVPISISGPVLNSKQHWVAIIGGMGRQYLLHNHRLIMIFINLIIFVTDSFHTHN